MGPGLGAGRAQGPRDCGRDQIDHELAQRARDGEVAALVLLYRRYVNEVYGYLVGVTGDAQDAEDLTSETFLRVVRRIDSFQGRSAFRTWLYEIARNVVRDQWRRASRRPRTVALDEDSASPPAPAATGAAREATRLGRETLRRLPPAYRRVLELRILEGRSVADTAVAMGKTENHVKVLTHRALKAAARIAAGLGTSAGAGTGRPQPATARPAPSPAAGTAVQTTGPVPGTGLTGAEGLP